MRFIAALFPFLCLSLPSAVLAVPATTSQAEATSRMARVPFNQRTTTMPEPTTTTIAVRVPFKDRSSSSPAASPTPAPIYSNFSLYSTWKWGTLQVDSPPNPACSPSSATAAATSTKSNNSKRRLDLEKRYPCVGGPFGAGVIGPIPFHEDYDLVECTDPTGGLKGVKERGEGVWVTEAFLTSTSTTLPTLCNHHLSLRNPTNTSEVATFTIVGSTGSRYALRMAVALSDKTGFMQEEDGNPHKGKGVQVALLD
ncbi:hypothetical protein JCM11641_001251 [Rhodosporidiobolus odoratus]